MLVRKSGKEVIVWTVNSRGWIKWFDKLGVDGIMTDDPNLFK
jgi:glycerophosphoryl diester phosphodiesterase